MSIAEDVIEDLKTRVGKTLDDLRRELAKVRTGRANPAILDSVRVDYYGTPTPLNGLASVSVADARLIVIKPWDRSALQAIEKALHQSDIGINPQSDAEVIRLAFPPLTEERRKELVKGVRAKGEDHKVAIRNVRREAKELIDESVKEGDLPEDDGVRAMDRVQAEVDLGVKGVDEIVAKKTQELMEV